MIYGHSVFKLRMPHIKTSYLWVINFEISLNKKKDSFMLFYLVVRYGPPALPLQSTRHKDQSNRRHSSTAFRSSSTRRSNIILDRPRPLPPTTYISFSGYWNPYIRPRWDGLPDPNSSSEIYKIRIELRLRSVKLGWGMLSKIMGVFILLTLLKNVPQDAGLIINKYLRGMYVGSPFILVQIAPSQSRLFSHFHEFLCSLTFLGFKDCR